MSTLTQARTDRDTGMARATETEARRQPGFSAIAYDTIVAVARRQPTVHVDDVLSTCTVRPTSPNAWGSVWARAIRDGVIAKSGKRRPCTTDRRKQAHDYPIYDSLLFRPVVRKAAVAPNAPKVAARQADLFAGGAL